MHRRRVSRVDDGAFRTLAPMRAEQTEATCSLWRVFARLTTCCVPSWLLGCCGWDEDVRRAWREKVALCVVIAAMCALLALLTFGIGPMLCPASSYSERVLYSDLEAQVREGGADATLAFGRVYDAKSMAELTGEGAESIRGRDIGASIAITVRPECAAVIEPAALAGTCTGEPGGQCWSASVLSTAKRHEPSVVAYTWDDVAADGTLRVVNGAVVRLPSERVFIEDALEALVRNEIDATRGLHALGLRGAVVMSCLAEVFGAGKVSLATPGCAAYTLISALSLVAIGTLIVVRFVLAVTFSWFLSRQLDRMGGAGKRSAGQAADAWADPPVLAPVVQRTLRDVLGVEDVPCAAAAAYLHASPPCPGDSEPFVVLLVTCYSEGEASLRVTLDSLAHTDYEDRRKLLLVVADGGVIGAGNAVPTPAIVRAMMDIPPALEGSARPALYPSVAPASAPSMRVNAAVVHAGEYVSTAGRRVPCVLVEKVGNADELLAAGRHDLCQQLLSDPRECDASGRVPQHDERPCPNVEDEGALKEDYAGKPGNRGKRDSQLVLMAFMMRVLLDERMCALDTELFARITWLLGVTPDALEIVLMVDADTAVEPRALTRMVAAMRRDGRVMGLCGETRIANKRASWVSMIQVFEYYVSHHLGKAFESFFGGVTCLPGCFCMYRIRAPVLGGDGAKHGADGGPEAYVPVLANPLVVEQYAQSTVATLHDKNLLLLGEDRFLTTLLLKNFPKRRTLFVPRAVCRTLVPETFRVLLSQRRRWINSTIHNLLELVRVPGQCGVFCCSMQFAIFMDLVGTLVLPAAIVFTAVLIANAAVDPRGAIVPLILLAMVLGLPAVLILLTTRRVVYVAWMAVYLLALPVWNFVLPLYAYWHFDDFTWGATRPTAGGDAGHGGRADAGPGCAAPMRSWLAWSAWWHREDD